MYKGGGCRWEKELNKYLKWVFGLLRLYIILTVLNLYLEIGRAIYVHILCFSHIIHDSMTTILHYVRMKCGLSSPYGQ